MAHRFFPAPLTWNEIDGKNPHQDTLKRALVDQLDLELAPDSEPVEMLVVEKSGKVFIPICCSWQTLGRTPEFV